MTVTSDAIRAATEVFVHGYCLGRSLTPLRIWRVDTVDLAQRFASASRSRVMTPSQIGGTSPFRQYVALEGDASVGWVRSVSVGNCAWVANMGVIEQQRRRGIGSALLNQLLRDDRAFGMCQSVLLARHVGALLYPILGYQQIGLMYIFAPPR